jgi:hypothetical protein
LLSFDESVPYLENGPKVDLAGSDFLSLAKGFSREMTILSRN